MNRVSYVPCSFDGTAVRCHCKACGQQHLFPPPVDRNGQPEPFRNATWGHVCGAAQTAAAPTLLQQAANFAASAVKHVAAGMPRCTQEQVDARFAICQGCEHYDGKACRLCGCPVVREQAFVSKLSWANEKCPAGKWGPVTG